ncbi:hypothetical protein AB0G86_06575 [Streptomyces scabiei]|uniref:hypothetical protein n=1 Tax=Streptomyces scabiei TaxID=1930 RepID=UPI0033D0DCBF
MFQPTPVYDRLVAERGDVPVQVRGEADRIHRDLAQVLRQTSGFVDGIRHHLSLRGENALFRQRAMSVSSGNAWGVAVGAGTCSAG